MAGETLDVCKICFNSSSHKASPTLTPLSRAVVDATSKRTCPACKQPWSSQKVAKDSDTQKWVAIRPRPKIDSKIDYQLCVSVQKRQACQKGQAVCTYAHSKVELLEWNKERWRDPRPVPVLNGPFQFQLCKHIQNTGTCPYGQRCTFAHSEEELEQWISAQSGLGAGDTIATPTQSLAPPTQECYYCHICNLRCTSHRQLEEHLSGTRHRSMLSSMRVGPSFIPPPLPHANHDFRGVVRQRPTRIPVNGFKLCNTVMTGRRCYYGDRCTFAHSDDELQLWNEELVFLRQGRFQGFAPSFPTSQHLGPQSGDLDEFDSEGLWGVTSHLDEDGEEGMEEQMDFAQQMRMRVKYAHQDNQDLPGLEVDSRLSHEQCIAILSTVCYIIYIL